MDEKNIEPPEYPKMRYTRNGERYVDSEEFIRSKTGRRLMERVLKMKINPDEKLDSRD